jgi:hypothetical protein
MANDLPALGQTTCEKCGKILRTADGVKIGRNLQTGKPRVVHKECAEVQQE